MTPRSPASPPDINSPRPITSSIDLVINTNIMENNPIPRPHGLEDIDSDHISTLPINPTMATDTLRSDGVSTIGSGLHTWWVQPHALVSETLFVQYHTRHQPYLEHNNDYSSGPGVVHIEIDSSPTTGAIPTVIQGLYWGEDRMLLSHG